ncbi:MAG: hypothetical protein WKG01_26260 [Kofleriaceae bacterium]
MSTAKRRSQLESERAQLEGLLTRTKRAIERVGLEFRLATVTSELDALKSTLAPKHGETDLTFYGDPVVGSEGIDAIFASSVLSAYQDLISKVHASRESVLRGSGPVPDEARARLHLTDVIHGSFGFQLREIEAPSDTPQTKMFMEESSLFAAVEDAAKLIQAAGSDDERFVDEMDTINPRVHEAVRKFFSTVQDSGATFRLNSARTNAEFDRNRVDAAIERINVEWHAERTERLLGVFGGVLSDSRSFEHRPHDTVTTIRGKADSQLALETLVEWWGKQCVAVVRVRRWQRGAREFKRYTLLDVVAPDALPTQRNLDEDATS